MWLCWLLEIAGIAPVVDDFFLFFFFFFEAPESDVLLLAAAGAATGPSWACPLKAAAPVEDDKVGVSGS